MSQPKSEPILELAPGKLNLALSVGPPDDAGMHPICSWMVTIDFFDELELLALPAGSLSRYAIVWHEQARRTSDIDWSISRDLAVRSHLALQEHVGRDLPVQMKLLKRIPVSGGLGGGSSNAAAMLRAANRLFELGLSLDELAQIGAQVGSDVPFFVRGGSAIVTGRGEQVDPHDDLPDVHAVVVLPEQMCPTGQVYAAFDRRGGAAGLREADVAALVAQRGEALNEALFNDLTEPAVETAPALGESVEQVAAVAERPVHVTGSGSGLFVICDDPLHAEALAEAIEQRVNLPAIAAAVYDPAHEPSRP